MTHGLLVVGLLFGLCFLMVVGVHSTLRDLLTREVYPRHLYGSAEFDKAQRSEPGK
jgi:hypothetical protein